MRDEVSSKPHMKYVFGPVPSRRLGKSLGIDPIPLKTCNWNCVYCQLGRTRPVVNIRKEYVPTDDLLAEVREALATHPAGSIDWVTFVGSGEPTLHLHLGRMIREVKAMTDHPVAVITNGALLYRPEVRQELSAADAVLPTLVAGSPLLYRTINRPHPEITFEKLLDGLITFRQDYQGKLWVEVMIVGGLNDTEEALHDLAVALARVQPDQTHVVFPVRPPAELWVPQQRDEESLMRIQAILGARVKVFLPTKGEFDLNGCEDLLEAILAIITRHPMRQEELETALARWAPAQVRTTLDALEHGGQAQIVERFGSRFWCAKPSYFQEARKGERKK